MIVQKNSHITRTGFFTTNSAIVTLSSCSKMSFLVGGVLMRSILSMRDMRLYNETRRLLYDYLTIRRMDERTIQYL
jgi:hypothetical protein